MKKNKLNREEKLILESLKFILPRCENKNEFEIVKDFFEKLSDLYNLSRIDAFDLGLISNLICFNFLPVKNWSINPKKQKENKNVKTTSPKTRNRSSGTRS